MHFNNCEIDDKTYSFEWHVVEENRQWSIDPVWEFLGRDDKESEDWFVVKDPAEGYIGKLPSRWINEDLEDLFYSLKMITKNYPSLRLRVVVNCKENNDV